MNIEPKPNLNQSAIAKSAIEQEKKPELEAVPIFRANDLYEAMFPEIEPVFKRGEEPTAQKLFNILKIHTGKKVILDKTCRTILSRVNNEEIQEAFVQTVEMGAQRWDALLQLIKDKLNVEIVDESIDSKIDEFLQYSFSPELITGLLQIAIQKNGNIKRVIIVTDHLDDHFGPVDKKTVLRTFSEGIKSTLGIDPVVIPNFDDTPQESDVVIIDRHTTSSSFAKYELKRRFPIQVMLLPLASELHANEEYLNKNVCGGNNNFAEQLRKKFEVVAK